MRQRKQSFRHESLQDAKTIQALLEAVTDGIAKGRVTDSNEEEMILKAIQTAIRMADKTDAMVKSDDEGKR